MNVCGQCVLHNTTRCCCIYSISFSAGYFILVFVTVAIVGFRCYSHCL